MNSPGFSEGMIAESISALNDNRVALSVSYVMD